MIIINEDNTLHEIEFLRRLGRWSDIRMPRAELLDNYIAAANLRVRWDGIDSERVIALARAYREAAA